MTWWTLVKKKSKIQNLEPFAIRTKPWWRKCRHHHLLELHLLPLGHAALREVSTSEADHSGTWPIVPMLEIPRVNLLVKMWRLLWDIGYPKIPCFSIFAIQSAINSEYIQIFFAQARFFQGAAGCKPGPPAAAGIPCWSDGLPDFFHHSCPVYRANLWFLVTPQKNRKGTILAEFYFSIFLGLGCYIPYNHLQSTFIQPQVRYK